MEMKSECFLETGCMLCRVPFCSSSFFLSLSNTGSREDIITGALGLLKSLIFQLDMFCNRCGNIESLTFGKRVALQIVYCNSITPH